MHLGFTGSRQGLTPAQQAVIIAILTDLAPTTLHHGDCTGADAAVHAIAVNLGIAVVIHPPTNSRLRAYCAAPDVLPPQPYLVRNAAIVAATAALLAAPNGPRRPRSGTWFTVGKALAQGKRVIVVLLNGLRVETAADP